jgi:superfamily II DNA or RNA helicase
MTELRAYQTDIIGEYGHQVAAGLRRIILVAPTGAGKTVIAAAIIKGTRATRSRVLVISHRREITTQTSRKLYDNDIPHGIIQAGFPSRSLEEIQLASIQTLWRRAIRTNAMALPPADLLIIDECHHCPAETYRRIIDAYPDAVVLGLTATPCRGDGRGLGGIFQTIIECPQVAQLIKGGYLVKTRVYAPVNPDLKGVRVQAGDYVESQLADRMDQTNLVGDVVTHWHKYSERRKTVCFAVNVAHSIHLRDEFIRSGVRAEHIDGSTPKAERDASLARLASGEIELVTNCMVLTEGWDMPEVGCCILARPTRKMGLYRQMVGRVLRPAEGKADAIILDHSGAVFQHGFAEDPVEWTLAPDGRAESRVHAKRCEFNSSSRILECSQCSAIRVAGEPCPHCGFLPQRPPRSISMINGDLGLVEGGRAKAPNDDPFIRSQWLGMLTAIASEGGYKPGWTDYKFKEKFGTWPPRAAVQPITPSPEVRAWVRSRNIAYHKAQQKARREPQA